MQPQMPPAAAAMAKSNLTHHAKKFMSQNSGMPGEAAGSAQGDAGAAPSGGASSSAQLDELEKLLTSFPTAPLP